MDPASALPAHGHLGRRERGHELVASEQLAEEHDVVATVGLDDPQRLAGSAGKLDDAIKQRLDRRPLVRDALPHDLLAIRSEHHDPLAVPAWVDPDDQASRHLAHLRAVGSRGLTTRRAAALT